MRWIRFAVLVCLVAVLQAGLVDAIAVTTFRIKPDFLLILLVFFSTCSNISEAIITSFVIGFAADIAGGSVMGPRIISLGLFGTALAYLHSVIAIRKMSYQSLAVFVVCFLSGVLVCFLTWLTGQSIASNVYAVLFGTSLYSALAGPFLLLPSALWMRIKAHRSSRN